MATFIHTADLHLGRQLYGERLLDDQRVVLDQLVDLVQVRRPTALLIAGDVYDRSVPPAEAVELLDSLVVRVAGELQTPIIMIPGNHDSADRLGFGSRLMGAGRLHIAGTLKGAPEPVMLSDEAGPIAIYALPFLEPARVSALTQDTSVNDQQSAWAAMLQPIRAAAEEQRSVLVGHAFVQGCTVSESERPLSIGGADTIQASLFDGLSYVALGHLHQAQSVGSDRVQYSGSPLKYSLSEVNHSKAFTVVELSPAGEVSIERVPVAPRRDLRRVQGTLADLLQQGPIGPAHDYVVVTLTDKGAVHEPMARLREIYPNTLHIERVEAQATTPGRFVGKDHRSLDLSEHFSTFFEGVTGEPLDGDERALLTEVLAELKVPAL